MKRFKLSKHFYLDEVVDYKLYMEYSNRGQLYKLAYKIDTVLLNAMETIRVKFDIPMSVNTWWKVLEGNNFNTVKTSNDLVKDRNSPSPKYNQYSGLRRKGEPYYNSTSMHTEFKAVDIHLYGLNRYKLNEIRKYIFLNWKVLGISGMEVEVNWLHIDTRFIPNQTEIFIFNSHTRIIDWKYE